MKSLAVALLLATSVYGLQNHNNFKLNKLAQSLSRAQQTNNGQTCQSTIKRVKQPTIDYNSIIKAGKPFTDPEFQLTNDGFYWPTLSTGWYTGKKWAPGTSYDLARARDKLPKATLWGATDQVGPNDLDQGSIGNCYFIASCAALAEWNDRVKRTFVTQDYNQAGIIVIRGLILGNPKEIVVDDILPFKPKSTKLLFDAMSTSGGLWGPFIEKAWAKLNGNYEYTNGGQADEVLQFLFGTPTVSLSKGGDGWQTYQDIWNQVQKGDQNKFIMWAATPGEGDDTQVSTNGLAKSHAYTINGVFTVKNADGSVKANLYLCRNPWGSDGGYKGAWNDKDPIWQDTVNKYASQVPYVNADDGQFFISDIEFHSSYSYVQIGFYDSSYVHSTSTVYAEKGFGHRFDFTLTETLDGFFGIDFYNSRMYPKGCKLNAKGGYVYAAGSFRVYKDGVFVDGTDTFVTEYDNYGFVRKQWGPGKYTVMFETSQWHADDVRDFSFRTFLPKSVSITVTSFDSDKARALVENALDLTSGKATLPFTTTDAKGFQTRKGWYSNGYQYGINGAAGKDCTVTLTLYAYGGSAQLDSDNLQGCTSTVAPNNNSYGQFLTTYTCVCKTTKNASGNKQCAYQLAAFSDSLGQSAVGTSISSKSTCV